MNGNSTKSAAMIVAIVALVIGGGAGYVLGHKKDDTTKNVSSQSNSAPATDTKSAGLRVLLNNLEAQHVDLASAATRAGFSGDKSFQAAAGALDKNSHALADAVGSVYGKEAGDKFYEIWNSHIGFFVNYTVAASKGDKAGMDKAVQDLNGYVEAVSAFLSGANPNLPKDAVAQLVTEHVGLLKNAVDKYGAGDYAGSYEAQQAARDQITTKIADTLAGAIVKQKPEAFKQ
ncbi:MAG TPA: hypothetical protein VM124_01315 [Candidatus Limnocylindrales bacterium]|nr:hypothetical protein [Candidatus Limnocylindrales bacterium]